MEKIQQINWEKRKTFWSVLMSLMNKSSVIVYEKTDEMVMGSRGYSVISNIFIKEFEKDDTFV